MANWYEVDNLTSEQIKQQRADFYNMFYGDRSKQACFALLMASVEVLPNSTEVEIIRKESLRDFIKQIKAFCGLNDFRFIAQTEALAINDTFNQK